MAARKVLKSVLWNFLGTYMSRYSDFDGYWLFGFLVPEIDTEGFDLLSPHTSTDTPLDTAAHLAEARFTDQLAKAGIDKSLLRSARLTISRLPEMTRGRVLRAMPTPSHFEERNGYNVVFRVDAQLTDDAQFSVERAAFVAPHDPLLEQRYPGQTGSTPSTKT